MEGNENFQRSRIFFKVAESLLLGAFYTTKILSLVLPPTTLHKIYKVLGYALFYARPQMRKRLLLGISASIPQIGDPAEIARIGREACSSALLPMLDLILFWRYKDRFMRELKIEGSEYLDQAESQGKGVIILFAHLGAYVLLPVIMYHIGRSITPIIFHPAATPVPRYISTLAEFGSNLGCDPQEPVFWTGQNMARRAGNHLKKGKRLAVTFDVDGQHIVNFFERPAALAGGIARFSLGYGAPIVPLCCLRGEREFQLRLVFSEPLMYAPAGNIEEDIHAIMEKVAQAGEEMIRLAPHQWMSWFGLNRWWDKAREIKAA